MKILKLIHDSLFFIFILILICFLWSVFKTKNCCGYSIAIVQGNSMYPQLYDGDFLILKHDTCYYVDDIICFKDKQNLNIVHRIIDINENKIITKGDFNKLEDEPINKNQIIGKVVYKSTLLGFIFQNIHIVLICLILFVIFKLKNVIKYDKIKL